MLSAPLIWTVRGYQRLISRFTPPVCRFTPSCSSYAIGALRVHGPLRGSALAMWRILRCNPFFPGGYDPVPPAAGTPAASPPASHQSPDPPPTAPDAGPRPRGPHGEGDPS
jgi:putative membrane protein insertion efficiency factor